MSKRLEAEINTLKTQFGIGQEDLTPKELEMLVLACRRCDSPFSNVNAALCGQPVFVSPGVAIWPITAGAHIWLEEFAATWWKRSSSMFAWARVYALAHAREPDAFAHLTTRWEARLAVMKTILRFACYREELRAAIDRAYSSDSDQVPETKADREQIRRARVDFSAMVAELEVYSGISAKEWLWGKALIDTAKAYTEMHRFAAAFDPKRRVRMKDELDDALNDLARVRISIVRRIRAERAKKEEEHEQGA